MRPVDRRRFLHDSAALAALMAANPRLSSRAEAREDDSAAVLKPGSPNEVLRVAVIGLGSGSMAAHAKKGDVFKFYDIDPKVLKEGGSAGHWGLRGVRERAERIGAQLDFWSEAGAGTEVQLTVPASVAFEARRNGAGSGFLGKKGTRA